MDGDDDDVDDDEPVLRSNILPSTTLRCLFFDLKRPERDMVKFRH